jgi:hypothetical protein
MQAQVDTISKRGRYTLRGALMGTGIGAGAGFIAAYASTRGNYMDHSEDGLLYVFFPLCGAVIGMLVGGVLGYGWN